MESIKYLYWQYFNSELKDYYYSHLDEVEGETYDEWLERLDLDFILEISGRE